MPPLSCPLSSWQMFGLLCLGHFEPLGTWFVGTKFLALEHSPEWHCWVMWSQESKHECLFLCVLIHTWQSDVCPLV